MIWINGGKNKINVYVLLTVEDVLSGGWSFVGGRGYRCVVWVDAAGPRLAESSVEDNCASSLC